MDIRKLQRAIVDGLEDVKAQNIVVFNTEHLSALFERVIIASGTSNRQTKSLASSVRGAVKDAGYPVPRTEGETNGEWIIVDCGAAVVHVMQPSIRDYYHLEEIWGDKPVRMKLDGGSGKLVKAAEPDAAPKKKRVATKSVGVRKTPANRVATTQAPARKAAPRRAGAPLKSAVMRTTGVKTAVTRTTGVKSAATRTIVVNAPVARKGAAKKVGGPARGVARKAPVRKGA